MELDEADLDCLEMGEHEALNDHNPNLNNFIVDDASFSGHSFGSASPIRQHSDSPEKSPQHRRTKEPRFLVAFSSPSPFSSSNQQHVALASNIENENMTSEEAVWNHQMELEQMQALEQLSLDDDDDFDHRKNNKDRLGKGNVDDLVHEEVTAFPCVDPPAPILSSPSFLEHSKPVSPNVDDRFNSFSNTAPNNLISNHHDYTIAATPFPKRSSSLGRSISTTVVGQNDLKTNSDASMKKKFEIEILQLKKQLLSEKQEHLEAFRKEMMMERQNLTLKMQDQITLREKQWNFERESLKKEIESLRSTASAKSIIPTRPETVNSSTQYIGISTRSTNCQTENIQIGIEDISTQTEEDHIASLRIPSQDELSRLQMQVKSLRSINDSLSERESSNQIQIAKLENEVSAQLAEITALKDQVRSLEKKKSRKIPDPSELQVQDTSQIEAQVEKKYSDAYKAAVEHLKTSYANLTNSLKQRVTISNEKDLRDLKQKLDDSLSANQLMASNFEAQIALLKDTIKDLQTRMEAEKQESDRIISDMNNQYVATLRRMRDDVARSKVKSVEKIKDAWAKKKVELETVWKARVDALKEELDRLRQSKENFHPLPNMRINSISRKF